MSVVERDFPIALWGGRLLAMLWLGVEKPRMEMVM